MIKQILFILSVILLFIDCKDKDIEEKPAENKKLKDVASFPVGAAIAPGLLKNNTKYRKIVDDEFSSVTTENVLKMHSVHPQANVYNYTDADYIINYATENNKRVHGHVLIWHEFEKIGWIKDFAGDSVAWENLMKTHIQTVVGHYKGKIKAWDVVNEAIRNDGKLRILNEKTADWDTTGSIWARKLGKDYIARAFQYAHEADPNALLFYNEYGQEYSDAKLKATVDLVMSLKARGIPIHGVGLQMHTNIKNPRNKIEKAISDCANTGLLVHISELDVRINPTNTAGFKVTDAILQEQKSMYKFIASAYLKLVPKQQQHGITTWNVGDADSWIRPFFKADDYPLPFDDDYNKKPAYEGFMEGLSSGE